MPDPRTDPTTDLPPEDGDVDVVDETPREYVQSDEEDSG